MPRLYNCSLCNNFSLKHFDSHAIILLLLFLQLLNACIHESRRMEVYRLHVMLDAPAMDAGAVCSTLWLGEWNETWCRCTTLCHVSPVILAMTCWHSICEKLEKIYCGCTYVKEWDGVFYVKPQVSSSESRSIFKITINGKRGKYILWLPKESPGENHCICLCSSSKF